MLQATDLGLAEVEMNIDSMTGVAPEIKRDLGSYIYTYPVGFKKTLTQVMRKPRLVSKTGLSWASNADQSSLLNAPSRCSRLVNRL